MRLFLLSIISCSTVATVFFEAAMDPYGNIPEWLDVVCFIINIAITVSSYSMIVRRWHDLDKTGWHALWIAIPIVNIFVGIYLLCKSGTPAPNRFEKNLV